MEHFDLPNDPLRLRDKPEANAIRLTRAAPHPAVEELHSRLTSRQHADSVDVRLVLLAHLIYVAYRDIKESFAL